MTPEQLKILRDAISERDKHGTRGPVEAEHHSCSPGRVGNVAGTKSDTHSDLIDEHGRVILDTLNSDVACIEQPDSDTAFDRVGRADVDFVAAAWWGLPLALDKVGELSTYLASWAAATHRLNEAGIADGPLDGRIAVVLAERDAQDRNVVQLLADVRSAREERDRLIIEVRDEVAAMNISSARGDLQGSGPHEDRLLDILDRDSRKPA